MGVGPVVAQRIAGYTHRVETPRGHALVADEPPEKGGADEGPKPVELLAASLASCTAVTMEMYAERKGWDLAGLTVEVETESEGYTLTGFKVMLGLPEGLDVEQRAKLRVIAGKCPVHRALDGGTPVEIV